MPEIAMPQLLTREFLGPWVLDAENTSVRLANKTMWGLVTVKGTLTAVEGAGQIESDGSLTGAIVLSASSIATGNKKRDEHLRSAEFFDVANHPTLDVRISGGTVVDAQVRLQSQLTVKGITEPLTLVTEVTGSTPTSVTVAVDVEVDRQRFGLSWNKGGMIKGPATVHVDARFTRVN